MRAFITGASRGLGEAFARHYGRDGATLGLLARRGDVLENLADSLRKQGATVHVYAADVSDWAAVNKAVHHFVDQAGGADLVLANAGVAITSALRQGDSEPVAKLMSINVVGVTNTVIPFVPVMIRQRSGTLVALSSMAAHRGVPGRAAYCASKAAVTTFMDALRMELHDTGVHAMSLCPGFVRTPMTATAPSRLPFLIDLDDAIRQMTSAIERRETTYTLPWQMNLLRHVIVRAPEWLIRRFAPPPRTESTL